MDHQVRVRIHLQKAKLGGEATIQKDSRNHMGQRIMCNRRSRARIKVALDVPNAGIEPAMSFGRGSKSQPK